jgi:hypothetical protein
VLTAANTLGVTPFVLGVLVTIACVAYQILFWVGRSGKQAVFVAAGILVAVLCVMAAIWYGQVQYWSRAFFLIVLAFFGGTMPFWQWLAVTTPRHQRLLLYIVLGSIGAVLGVAILVVYLLQQNMWRQNETEFFNRVTTAQNILTGSIDGTKSALIVAASNPDLVEAVEKKDAEELARIGKILYETNNNIRRVGFLDKEGAGVALYPYGTFSLPNYEFREYFQKARDTKSVYVSDVFQAGNTTDGRSVLGISVPLFNAKGIFVGVMSVSFDLEKLGLKLRQLAVESRGEYFMILDRNKKILSHPDFSRIGQDTPKEDVLHAVDTTKRGVATGKLPSGVWGLVAYSPVDPVGWTVTLRVPITQVFSLTLGVAISMFGTIAAIMIVAIWLLMLFHLRIGVATGGGS